MKLNIRGDKLEITKSIKKYVEEKLARLDRYFENPNNIEALVFIKVKGPNQTVEVTIPTKGITLRREETTEDLYSSIDLVLDKLERQIRKNKTKLEKKSKLAPNFEMLLDFEPVNEPDESSIVKRKTVDNKPMSEEEAILQLELLNHDFFVFKNVNEECTSVLYRRKAGNYGIINIK